MALSNLALFGGAFFTPVIVGKITHTIGWKWSFYLIAIFAAALLPFLIFFVPETTYLRPEPTSKLPSKAATATRNGGGFHNSPPTSLNKEHLTTYHEGNPPPKATFIQSLALFNGRKTSESFLKLSLRPFPLLFHPAVLWAMLIQGALIGWTVMIGVVLAAIFLGPPLWFTEVTTGYMYTGPFVGALLGFAVAGLLADWSAKLMIRLNKGVYEPEFRILLVIPQLVIGCAGLYGFGITAASVTRYGWFWPDFFFALEVMGMVLGAVASALYIVDAHSKPSPFPFSAALNFIKMMLSWGSKLIFIIEEIAVEAFTCLLLFKNMFSFALTWGAYNWLVDGGIKKTFYAISSVQVGVCLLSIPMCKCLFLFLWVTTPGPLWARELPADAHPRNRYSREEE